MTISELLTFGIASSGITFIAVYGKIFDKIRPTGGWIGKLFSCTLCMGFWVGAFLCGINDYTELFNINHTFVNYLLCGGMGSAFSYAFDTFLGDNGFRIENTHVEPNPTCDDCAGPTHLGSLESIMNQFVYEPPDEWGEEQEETDESDNE